MIRRLLAAVLFLGLPQASGFAQSAEEILSFESQIEVRADATLLVTETIKVRAQGAKIKRGIYRDFPVRHRTADELWDYVDFKLLEVLRDGHPEPHHTTQAGNYRRIYAGDEDRFLRPDIYTYTIRYATGRQVRYFEDFDELFWNVTGNFWEFPIRRAVVRIRLPEGARIGRRAGYTGRHGTTGADYRVIAEGPSEIAFASIRSLAPGEGLTVAVAWQKGLVAEPTETELMLYQIWDNVGLVVLFAGALLVFVYFWWAWTRVGRDPPRGTIIPLFEPPEGLSPAAASFIHYMGFSKAGRGATKPFIAALVSLAVKGRLAIVEEGKDIAVARVAAGKGGDDDMSPGEKVLYDHLLGTRERIAFTKANGTTLKAARSRFRSKVLKEYGGRFFNHNRLYFGVGLAVSVVTLVAFLALHQPTDVLIGGAVVAAIGTAVISMLIAVGSNRVFGLGGGARRLVPVAFMIAGFLFTMTRGLAPENFAVGTVGIAVAAAIIALVILNITFLILLRAPTPEGARIMEAIEGFRLYLKVAEADRMNMAGAPAMSEKIYETYLPYAIALGVEKPWSQAFADHMAKAMPDERRRSYRPRWYRGDRWDSGRLGSSASGLVSSVSSSMASAMPAPKSSSGSSGGGFSGGGGGGGGGGGW